MVPGLMIPDPPHILLGHDSVSSPPIVREEKRRRRLPAGGLVDYPSEDDLLEEESEISSHGDADSANDD